MNIKLHDKVKVVKKPMFYTERQYFGLEGVVVQKRGVYSQVRFGSKSILWFEDVELEVINK